MFIPACGDDFSAVRLSVDELEELSGSIGWVDVAKDIVGFDGTVIYTRDTHGEDYFNTQEGKNLPVKHCIKGTDGWQIRPELDALRKTEPIDKVTFGSSELGPMLVKLNNENKIDEITF